MAVVRCEASSWCLVVFIRVHCLFRHARTAISAFMKQHRRVSRKWYNNLSMGRIINSWASPGFDEQVSLLPRRVTGTPIVRVSRTPSILYSLFTPTVFLAPAQRSNSERPSKCNPSGGLSAVSQGQVPRRLYQRQSGLNVICCTRNQHQSQTKGRWPTAATGPRSTRYWALTREHCGQTRNIALITMRRHVHEQWSTGLSPPRERLS